MRNALNAVQVLLVQSGQATANFGSRAQDSTGLAIGTACGSLGIVLLLSEVTIPISQPLRTAFGWVGQHGFHLSKLPTATHMLRHAPALLASHPDIRPTHTRVTKFRASRAYRFRNST